MSGDHPPSLADLVDVLERLLYDRAVRDAFLADPLTPDLARPGIARELESIDTVELAAVGRRIVTEVLHGGIGTGAGLLKGFPRTFEAATRTTGRAARELAESFIASGHYLDFRDVPYSPRGRGLTVAEAFYGFVAEELHSAEVTELAHGEAARVISNMHALDSLANFEVKLPGSGFHRSGEREILAIVRECPRADGAPPTAMLHLSAPGRCVAGRVPLDDARLLLRALALGGVGPHGADADGADQRVVRTLEKWGLR